MLVEIARKVSRVKRIDIGRRKRGEWWNKGLGYMVKMKKKVFYMYLGKKKEKKAFNRYLGTMEEKNWEVYKGEVQGDEVGGYEGKKESGRVVGQKASWKF